MKVLAVIVAQFMTRSCVTLSYSWGDGGENHSVSIGINPPLKAAHQK